MIEWFDRIGKDLLTPLGLIALGILILFIGIAASRRYDEKRKK